MSRLAVAVVGVRFLLAVPTSIAEDIEYPWEIVAEQIEPIPLEYQAAVFRLTVRNKSSDTVPAPYPERSAGLTHIRDPGADEFREIRGDAIRAGRPTPDSSVLEQANVRVPLQLPPGYGSSVTVTFAARWSRGEMTPLLPYAGTYSVKFYELGAYDVVVRAPEGDDKLIRDLLHANPPLAAAMLSPINRPPEELVKPLQRLLKLYRESSYANYARYALARYYAGYYGSPALRGTTEDERIAASSLLSEIDVRNFAYGANAMMLDVMVQEALKRERARDVDARLKELFPDSFDYLDWLVTRIRLDGWERENPRKPRLLDEAAGEQRP